MDENLISRKELSQALFAILDINRDVYKAFSRRSWVAKIPKTTPDENAAQLRRMEEFRALLEKRLERDRELREAAERQES